MTEPREPSTKKVTEDEHTAISLRGKRALVTGGAKRLGRAFALALAQEGCDVVIHFNQSRDAAEETAAAIRDYGGRVFTIPADFTDSSSLALLARRTVESLGGLDILVNNASAWSNPATLGGTHRMLEETLEQWETNMAVNCRAPFFLMQHLAPHLRATHGTVVNILDTSVETPYLKRASHTISKSALLSASRVAAMSLSPEVRINCLELGPILPPDEMSEETRKKWAWAGAESAANALLFLLKNEFISGEILSTSGELHLRKTL